MNRRKAKAALDLKQIAVIVTAVLSTAGLTGGAGYIAADSSAEGIKDRAGVLIGKLEERIINLKESIAELKAEIAEINRRTQDIDRRTLTLTVPTPRSND